jgi:hypothetical protein
MTRSHRTEEPTIMTRRPVTASTGNCRLSCALVVGLIIFCTWHAAPLTQSANAKEVAKQPLRYRAIISEPSVCLNDSISIELELENASNHRVSVDSRALLHTVSVSREGGAVESTGDLIGKISPEQLVALEPGQSYRGTSSYPLKGKFFTMGLYSIRLTYGQFADSSPDFPDLYKGTSESNPVLFEIKGCD